MINRCYMFSPIGTVCIEEDGAAITALYIADKDKNIAVEADNCSVASEILNQAKQELTEYFGGKRKEFDLPLHMTGTEFQIKVWRELCRIPYGETRCYEDIAKAVGNPKACRAVGGANNKNHILILIPCHRVIGKNGSLVGFGGGVDVKKYLLELEQPRH